MDEYLAAKLMFFEEGRCGMALYNADDDRVSAAMERVRIPRRALGIRASADIIANDIEIGEKGCDFKLTFNNRFRLSVQLRLPGLFNVYNSLMAAAMCDAAGIKPESIRAGLELIKSVPGRIELLDTGTPYSVFLDYAHSPDALENILKTVKQIAKGRVIAVFGCGGDRDREKRPIMGEIGGRLADFCVLTSDNPRNEDPFEILAEIEEGIKPVGGDYVVIENRRDAIKRALTCALPGDVIVLAGKGHETYQEIKGVKCPFNEKTVVGEVLREMALSA
jgi:UDP-N-acetylmuramoyl-L-alanyl-D-glutamate--2,6-diaminopimelate ligase